MIIVTGATGLLGRAIVERLLERVPADQVGVSVRAPPQARELAARGGRVRPGAFADPARLAHAFEGASQVLIVSANDTGAELVRAHRAAIDAAKAAGAGRILYTSHMAANPSSLFVPPRDHAATEAALQDSGVPYTSLRNGFYASTVPMLLRGAAETGELALPADGPVAWTSHGDLAEAAAIALAGEHLDSGDLDGPTPALTGPEAIDATGFAQIAAELTGRPIRRVVVSDDDYRAGLIAHGVPEVGADMLIGMFAAGRQGEFAPADPALARLLGREPESLRDVLEVALT